MRELRERLERAVARLEEMYDAHLPGSEKTRLAGKIEGVKLALSYIHDEERVDDRPGEIVLPRLVGNPHYARGLVTPEVTHNGLVVVDFGDCRYVSEEFLLALIDEIHASGAAGILVRRASGELIGRVTVMAAGSMLTVVAG